LFLYQGHFSSSRSFNERKRKKKKEKGKEKGEGKEIGVGKFIYKVIWKVTCSRSNEPTLSYVRRDILNINIYKY
jgi:hypothetical protein